MKENDGIVCRHCQHLNAPEALLCANCGEVLAKDTTVWTRAQLRDIERPATDPQAREFEPGALYFYVASATNPVPLIHRGPAPVVLGRKSGVVEGALIDFSLYHAHSLGVSRQHARMVAGDTGYTVEDLQSANGTWLNGNRLEPNRRYPVRSGDHLQLGELVIFVYFAQSS